MIISKKILVIMSVASIAMLIGEIISIKHGIDYYGWRLWLGISLSVIASVSCIIDVIKNNNPRKMFWIISFIIFGSVGTFVYLIQRKDDIEKR
ncbi:PLDc N-terminal domain-containing protein [Weeksellaceae bacterium TAE3-ERU29]|nr:PLDc N-terminal domain-containing protein [Weeksellaceae bacterium TAE3-ERU29]